MDYSVFLAITICYLMSSVPYGLILVKVFYKTDIRTMGSNNIGATNVTRLSKKLGAVVFILDTLKAFIPVFIVTKLYGDLPLIILLCSYAAVIGHTNPIWLKFRGGKSFASYLGVLGALDYTLLIIAVSIWVAVFIIYRISGLSALCTLILIPFISLLYPDYIKLFAIMSMPIIVILHRENIKNLIVNNL